MTHVKMKIVFSTPWLTVVERRPNARIRLFCFPHAGGGASVFRTWSEGLPSTVEVCPIRLPGREGRISEPPFTRLKPLVQALAQALIRYLDKPFAFFGHSMGALVSFELARQLRRRHTLSPAHLFVSGRVAPQLPDPQPPIHALPNSKFLEELRRFNGIPEEILESPELMELMLPTLRADCAVDETYVYSIEPPLDCPISAFGGLQDSTVSRDSLAAWRNQTRLSFSMQMFPGNHFFLHTGQPLLLQTLYRQLHSLINVEKRRMYNTQG